MFSFSGPRDFSKALELIEPIISTELNELLCKPLFNEEIRIAAHRPGQLNALGPKGFAGLFYVNYWDVVVDPSKYEAARGFMNGNFLLKKLNHTKLMFIPKCQTSETILQFRAISLSNFFYNFFLNPR